MPPRKYAGSKTKKRTTRRRPTATTTRPKGYRRPQGPFRSINTSDPFPSRRSVAMHYSETLSLSSGAGGTTGSERIFRLNSLYDPDYTSTGHQPYGYDQISALYRKYKVNACQIDLVWTDPSEDGLVVCMQVQPPNATATLSSSTAALIKERPLSVTRVINNSGTQKVRVQQFFKIGNISGLTPLQFKADIDNFQAAVSADPVASPYLRLALGSDRATTGATVIVRVFIKYYATFFERNILPNS